MCHNPKDLTCDRTYDAPTESLKSPITSHGIVNSEANASASPIRVSFMHLLVVTKIAVRQRPSFSHRASFPSERASGCLVVYS